MLLLWLPPSFYFWAHAQLAPPRRMFTYALVGNGRIGITWADTLSQGFEIGVYRPDEAVEELGLRGLVLPEVSLDDIAGIFTMTTVELPLWLLAAICLAWPVTSFLVRRRRGRGFEVEAKGGGAVSAADS